MTEPQTIQDQLAAMTESRDEWREIARERGKLLHEEAKLRKEAVQLAKEAVGVDEASIEEKLDALTDQERVDLFNKYCPQCGVKGDACTCGVFDSPIDGLGDPDDD